MRWEKEFWAVCFGDYGRRVASLQVLADTTHEAICDFEAERACLPFLATGEELTERLKGIAFERIRITVLGEHGKPEEYPTHACGWKLVRVRILEETTR